MNVYTDTDLSDLLGIDLDELHTLRRRHQWPHIRLGRFRFRFTGEQVEQIVAAMSVRPEKADKAAAAVDAGLTGRSAARHTRGGAA